MDFGVLSDREDTEELKNNHEVRSEYSGTSDTEIIDQNDDEENDIFHDSETKTLKIEEQKGSVESSKFGILDIPQERLTLPHLRDPNTKISLVKLLKDVIGKDLSKISLPVYFNEPISLT